MRNLSKHVFDTTEYVENNCGNHNKTAKIETKVTWALDTPIVIWIYAHFFLFQTKGIFTAI